MTSRVRVSSTAVSRDKLFKEALELEQQDRAELAKLLIHSLDPATEQDVEEAWMREIDRRTAELVADDNYFFRRIASLDLLPTKGRCLTVFVTAGSRYGRRQCYEHSRGQHGRS